MHAILDEAYHCALGFVVDGEPRVLPTLHVRVGDMLYLHGSTGSRPLLGARGDGLPVCVTVTLLDGLVYARSQFHHSANYRSVVAHGVATLVTDETEKRAAMTALVEKVGARPFHADAGRREAGAGRDRRAGAAAARGLRPARTGGVSDDEYDLDLPYWAGVAAAATHARPSRAGRRRRGAVAFLPAARRRRRGSNRPALVGEHVILEPLDLSHVDELFEATADAEVWRHLPHRCRATASSWPRYVTEALAAGHRGERVPWVQRSARDRRGGRHDVVLRGGPRRDPLAGHRPHLPGPGRPGAPASTPSPSCCC